MLRRLFHRYERVIRYVIVGGVMSLLYSGLTLALLALAVVNDRVWAGLMASLFVIPISFFVHRRITYGDVDRARAQALRFAVVSGSTLAVNLGVLKLSQVFGLPVWSALVVGWVVVPLVNYLLNAVWVFRTRRLMSLDR